MTSTIIDRNVVHPGAVSGLSAEDQRLADLLAAGKTQAQIAVELGLHRSAVWRRAKRLRNRVAVSKL
jgi:DNA-binding CsgD family transcriptional regulator